MCVHEQWWLHSTSQWGWQTLLNMCMCSLHIQMTEWLEQWTCIQFSIKLKHSSTETIRMIQKAAAIGQLVIGSFITIIQHISYWGFGEIYNHPSDSVPLQPRFGTLWLLGFPKTKITFEREEISHHQWDSGMGQGSWWWLELCGVPRCLFWGDWDVTVLCTTFLVFCTFFNKYLYFSEYMAGYFLDRPPDNGLVSNQNI